MWRKEGVYGERSQQAIDALGIEARVWRAGAPERFSLTTRLEGILTAELLRSLVERYGGTSAAVEMHLDQLRRNAMLRGSVGDWARNQGVSLAYARALQRFLDQG